MFKKLAAAAVVLTVSMCNWGTAPALAQEASPAQPTEVQLQTVCVPDGARIIRDRAQEDLRGALSLLQDFKQMTLCRSVPRAYYPIEEIISVHKDSVGNDFVYLRLFTDDGDLVDTDGTVLRGDWHYFGFPSYTLR